MCHKFCDFIFMARCCLVCVMFCWVVISGTFFFSFFALQERPKNGPGDYDNNRRGNWCSYCKFYLALWFFSFQMFEFYMHCLECFSLVCVVYHNPLFNKNSGVSITAGYKHSTASCKTSCCSLFSLWASSFVWAFPYSPFWRSCLLHHLQLLINVKVIETPAMAVNP